VSEVIKYNYTITPQQILDLEPYEAKLEVISPLRDITFQDTILFFNPLNELIIIMVLKKQMSILQKKWDFINVFMQHVNILLHKKKLVIYIFNGMLVFFSYGRIPVFEYNDFILA